MHRRLLAPLAAPLAALPLRVAPLAAFWARAACKDLQLAAPHVALPSAAPPGGRLHASTSWRTAAPVNLFPLWVRAACKDLHVPWWAWRGLPAKSPLADLLVRQSTEKRVLIHQHRVLIHQNRVLIHQNLVLIHQNLVLIHQTLGVDPTKPGVDPPNPGVDPPTPGVDPPNPGCRSTKTWC